MYEKMVTAAKKIQTLKKTSPKVGIILGSGLGSFVEQIQNPKFISYNDIPFFHQTTVEGHEGRLILGNIDGVEIVALQGRIHAYEGHPMTDVVFPVSVLSTLGIEILFLTNAAGGINLSYSPGELILIEDHLNLMGVNPLVGPNINEMGPRFPDMTYTYNPLLREAIQSVTSELKIPPLKSGVYAGMLGPTYETPAEIKMLRSLGADMVGMSTVPEAIMANYLGIKICGISCITNMAAGIKDEALLHKDVKIQALKAMEIFSNIVRASIIKFKDI